ncbi:MAG: tRNA uridine-5-carboxymethylaminomethyl(34) synthesis GTPase MnmE [Burkholderiaceae bacterium]|nr:tRNA uridine-5-carboxymethylaminomethyl(34) synthesis GTPase MnmE [Sulfuritalea sp.]MCF8176782.1 tRNA uridine-5-carboxymethylaminomethyl(34) synthesis GTPase MnmE [Burkholderiaceae bacterium]MCF8183407.1 tRNA uridine-5-carboxymethylaminomethyl(34) synthesis GTPase MnmE [Polynucleobacter sp.]
MGSPRAESIAAIATAPGRGGIGVVRVSGPDLLGFAAALTGKAPPPRRAVLVDFLAADGAAIDRGIALYFPAPASFTGEDVLELQGHGGPVVMQMLLVRCIELGARVAEPGEFSQRAFLNDKIDLVQAEAVADLIEASTAAAVRSAVRSLSGEFSREVHALVARLVELRMLIEATLDFPEDEVDVLRDTDVAARLSGFRDDLESLMNRARAGHVLSSGLHVVLAGMPNVGKSSLLNRLAGEERAIVTEVAGTTRDAVRETIQIEGIPLHIIDTAGLRDTDDVVEKIGIERAWAEIERADVVLQLLDARSGETPADHAIAVRLPAGVERIVVENKCDLAGQAAARDTVGGRVHLRLSAKTGEGINFLHDELLRVAGWSGHGEDVVLARERHLEALATAAEKSALAARRLGQVELCAEELRLAQEALSRITGEFRADDLLGEIFSRFCIGK